MENEKKCKGCNVSFTKSNTKKGYTTYCSDHCYNATWWRNHPEAYKKMHKEDWRRKPTHTLGLGCVVCGFDRTVDKCHIIWAKDGGKITKANIIILCPNHHRLMDSNKLNVEEKKLLKNMKGEAIY